MAAATNDTASPVEKTGVFHALFGVLLPVATLLFELHSRAADAIYFDPVPSWWHVSLIAAVPAANAFAAWVLHSERGADHAVAALRATALAIAVAWVYALLFLPILPLSTIGILFYGMGILPWVPLFAALASMRVRRRLRRRFPEAVARARSGRVVLATLAVLALLEVPGWIVQVGFPLAASYDESEQRRGVALLRAAASDRALLRVVHRGRARANMTGHLFLGRGLLRLDVRGLDTEPDSRTYYRVTGVPASETTPPTRPGGEARGFFADTPRDGPGRIAPGLSLAASRIDAKLHAEAELVYLEWTLVLRNDHGRALEGRTEIVLPPEAAVTRATLWVNGAPRDAAFGPRGVVTEAYERVTARRRDPLLVVDAGPDRVALRCFPVPAGDTMRIRIGITAPLLLGADDAALRLPELAAPNFTVPSTLERNVWIESSRAFTSVPAALARSDAGARFVLRGSVSEHERHWIELTRGDGGETWAADAVSPNGVAIVQRVEPFSAEIDLVVAVVDGSARMGRYADEIADALATLPQKVSLGIVVASDEPMEILSPDGSREAALETLRRFPFVGGHDARASLELAFARAEPVPRAALLWIHEPVPLELSVPAALRQRLERRRDGPRWLELQTRPGTDALRNALGVAAGIVPVPRRASVGEDLSAALGRLSGRTGSFRAVRRRVLPPDGLGVAPPDSARSAHLSRLWARDRVRALLREGTGAARAEAAALATRYRVITPVSGAVVLERDVQYRQNDLEAPAPDADDALAAAEMAEIPFGDHGGPLAAIPEPGTGALTTLGLTALAAWRRARRRASARR